MSFDSTIDAIKSGLLSRWAGAVDPPYVATEEHFPGFTHQEIYDKVQAMQPVGLGLLADRWTEIGRDLDNLFSDFTNQLEQSMDGWEGGSRTAAEGASAAYALSGEELAGVARRVQPRLDEIAEVAQQLQSRIPPPQETTLSGSSIEVIEYVAAIAAAQHEAVREMTAVYSPTFRPGSGVGDNVPAFSAPVDPAPGFDDLGTNSGSRRSGGTTTSSDSATDTGQSDSAAANVTQPVTATPVNETARPSVAETTSAQQDPAADATTATESNNPVSPASVSPALAMPSTSNGIDTPRVGTDPGSPGYRSNSPAVQSPAVPVPYAQQPVSHNPVLSQANSASSRPTTVTRGYPGAGMMPGAGTGQRRDDESEHQIPSYLITEENGRELFGTIPKTAPPVLGVWDERK